MHDGIMRRGSVSSPGRSSRNPHVKTLSGATVYRPNTRRSPSASSPLANMAGLITRQDVDSLLLTFLLNETCLIVVVMLRGRLRLFGMSVLWFHLGLTWPACLCGSKYSGASSNCSMPPSPRATPTLGIEDNSKTGLFMSALKC